MCQLFGISAASPLQMRFSWERFALRGSEAGGNPDGWGIAYAEANDVHILRESTPAAESPLVSFLTQHGPASATVISHVRRATSGERALANTQPFARVLGGRTHVFAHNGHVPGVEEHGEGWLRPVGATDSERLFCELLSRLARLWRGPDVPGLDARTDVVTRFADDVRGAGAANFLYFDGVTLFAHGHRRTLPGDAISTEPGLYLLDCVGEERRAHCEGVGATGACERASIVATMPLGADGWRPLAAGELVRLEGGRAV